MGRDDRPTVAVTACRPGGTGWYVAYVVAASVVVAADDAYLVGLVACIAGVARHAAQAQIVVVDCGLSRRSRRIIESTVAMSGGEVTFRPPAWKNPPAAARRIAPASLARMFLEELGASH